MITLIVIFLMLFFVVSSLGPLLMTEDMRDIVQMEE
jgi:hypothetical protein